jgi:D-threonate/D-erythronate kinase
MDEHSMFILGLADDMTGALEVAAKFSAAGIESLVSAQPGAETGVPVVVYDTETRHLGPADAAERVKHFIRESRCPTPRLIYKKTDSTLRGNISAELGALSELFPTWRIGYAPAYPALGRTVKEGILYVDGVPVSETAFAEDILNPVRVSSIAAVLETPVAATIFDAEHDLHLEDAACAILADDTMRIAAGPGGLAEVLASQIEAPRGTPPRLPVVQSCLVLNGSLHERSTMQIRDASDLGWRLLQTSPVPGSDPATVASANARFLVEQIATHDPDGVFVIGGDTAFAAIAALGLPPLWPLRDVVPGVPVTRIRCTDLQHILPGRSRDLFLITKAGGFGEPDVIRRIHRELNPNAK